MHAYEYLKQRKAHINTVTYMYKGYIQKVLISKGVLTKIHDYNHA